MILILGSLAAFGPLSIDMYLPALPSLAAEFHTTSGLAQLSLSFFLIGLAGGQLVAGPLSDSIGRRLPLLVGLILYMITSLLCVFSPSIYSLIFLRLLQGIAGSAGIVISRAVVRDLYSGTELTKFFALIALVNGAAPILAPVLGGQFLRFGTWQGIFILLSLIGLIMFISVRFYLPETLSAEKRVPGGLGNTLVTFKRILADRGFLGYALAQGFVMASMFSYISGSPFVVQDIFGASPQIYSLIFAVNGLGIVLATQITGRIAGRIEEKRLFVIGLMINVVSGICLVIASLLNAGLLWHLVPLFFVVSSVGVVTTTGFTLAMQTQGKNAGSASALLGVLSLLMGGLVSPLVGLLGNESTLSMTSVILGAGLCAIISYILLRKK
ncbi:multidrug effflux MFS transporter [Niallia nealsonii]|uniref:Bcr/CflA family efflux transporter n=1 Tax=Niallia nealsonii TaxID=115979 RepID=A0A2N0Z157_9BACI|nr:multidrug effflux MFS transporter [Niallia nealsonii]PKG23252.1 MFS transporter [Niallia nealsonii]